MFYREAGQYKTSYRADQALFPIRQDQIGMVLILAVAFILVPLMASTFVIDSILIPVLIYSLAAIGLNLLTGYTGLLSLGTGGFMGVGAFACYKLATFFPGINVIVLIICSGFLAAAAGIVFARYARIRPREDRLCDGAYGRQSSALAGRNFCISHARREWQSDRRQCQHGPRLRQRRASAGGSNGTDRIHESDRWASRGQQDRPVMARVARNQSP